MAATPATLAGALNFRDLGGLPTADGRQTIHGAVFRSDALDQLTGEDVQTLREVLGVGSVIDLRAHVETGARRPAWAVDDTIDFVSLPLLDDWDEYGTLDDDGRRTLMARKYMSYLEAAGANVVAALELIAENAGRRPTVFHCAVGKDRSGVVAAMLLSILGVTRAAIVDDYLATQPNLEPLIERLRESEIYRRRVETNPREVYLAEAHTMPLFLEALDARFGGAEAWARAGGLEQETVERLRAQLLEPRQEEQR